MSEETKNEMVEEVVEQPVTEEAIVEEQPQEEQKPLEIQVDPKTAYSMKLLEYDKNIAEAKAMVANLEKEKIDFIYNTQVRGITEQYKQNMLRRQVEEETLKRAQEGQEG